MPNSDDHLRCMTVIPYLVDLHGLNDDEDEEDDLPYDDGITAEDIREGKLKGNW